MNLPVAEFKRALRAEARVRLAVLSAEQRLADSARIVRQLAEAPDFHPVRTVLAFHPLPTEPDLRPLFHELADRGQRVCLPRWDQSLAEYRPALLQRDAPRITGPFGVEEPGPDGPTVPWAELDLILVPGLAFDPMGRRLGRGRGFFDRLLARADRARRWGVAFGFQVVPELPAEPHDVPMHVLVTPERIWAVSPSS